MAEQTAIVVVELTLELERGKVRPPRGVGLAILADLLRGEHVYTVGDQETAASSDYRLTGVAIKSHQNVDSEPEPVDRNGIEKHREAMALRRKDHHVNSTRVLCAYDRCGETFEATGDGHPWPLARAAGWKLAWPNDATATDLYCPDEHDATGFNKTYA